MKTRATRICEEEELKAEEDYLINTFQKNGYPQEFISGALKIRMTHEEVVEETITVDLTKKKTLRVALCKGYF